ncbi:hypothetical protein [Diaphorobacter aerolatus]|uniref:Uncharacterized protein n=1 Tax=Diaphorobacter aerolatus TaxID=1288495 RepID=A0A7H0GLD5_9BURK|nr:hypothetical protein [Diaphorobacter aerolatus]QNP49101.1 hypothetical protein H9K75_02835 [Diaphorobacter aerolatus]
MMRMGKNALLAALAGIALCGVAQAGQVVAGLVSVTPQGRASFYFTEPLPDDQAISIQTKSVQGARKKGARTSCCTRIPRGELKAMTSVPEQVTNGSGRPVVGYMLERPLAGNWGENGFVGIAMSARKHLLTAASRCWGAATGLRSRGLACALERKA